MPHLVAVTATTRDIDGVERVRLNASYVRALECAGLTPVVLPPLDSAQAAMPLLSVVRGLVLTGGEDLDPATYGAARHAKTYPGHARRDRLELGVTVAAREAGLPTLAICRGIQVANVALGGTLVQDLPAEWPGALAHSGDHARNARVHDIRVESGTRLAAVLGESAIRVNSSHHQALGRVADGLRVTATAPDGVVEGVEWIGSDWWMLGVQWHPEELIDAPEPWDRQLFEAFARACDRSPGPTA